MSGFPTRLAVREAGEAAARLIPPLWPLNATVAVNPFLGQANQHLADASAALERAAGVRATMPRQWYAAKIASGEIADEDLVAARAAADVRDIPDLAGLKAAAQQPRRLPELRPTVAEIAARETGVDWPGFVIDRIGAWAAPYFDEGQALWAAPKGGSAFSLWRSQAQHDLKPEIQGLAGFAAFVAGAPETAEDALARWVADLGLNDAALQAYFHRLLMTLGGWAQLARTRHFEAERDGKRDTTIFDLLAIRATWDAALLKGSGHTVQADWAAAAKAFAQATRPAQEDWVDAILQDATERARQRSLANTLATKRETAPTNRPALQAVFCIDVRSEVIRRALESIDSSIQTLGFAGFFGLPIAYRDFASDVVEARLPVLLSPALEAEATDAERSETETKARIVARAKRAWGRFKLAAVSSFAFVEAMGPVYIARLLRDTLRRPAPQKADVPGPHLRPSPPLNQRVDMAATALTAMSLTDNFAPLVVIAGHGAAVTNNPHASALQCGACGGFAGDVNARLVAALLNDRAVRDGLLARAIAIPPDTVFVAALHNTTTDEVVLFDTPTGDPGGSDRLNSVRAWFAKASALARHERRQTLPSTSPQTVRARDWAETRPEWGLAKCSAFIAAPRHRTEGRSLEGRAFLHEYDWRRDENFATLGLILTAPVVVASWISLQYYGSVVAPDLFGAGNKLLHNVTGGVGVLEGNGGALRAGLPWQSVHDGERFMHEPLRLSVVIEAPSEAINTVLREHADVKALFDNGWLHLFTLGDDGALELRYAGDLEWIAERMGGVAVHEAAIA